MKVKKIDNSDLRDSMLVAEGEQHYGVVLTEKQLLMIYIMSGNVLSTAGGDGEVIGKRCRALTDLIFEGIEEQVDAGLSDGVFRLGNQQLDAGDVDGVITFG